MGLVISAMLGGIYAFSLYYSPLQQAYNLNVVSPLALAFSIITVSYSIFIIPAGVIYDRLGPKIPVVVGAFMILTGYVLGWYMKNFEDWGKAALLYYIGLGFFPGLGLALVDAVPRPLAAKWFPDRTGTAVGTVAFGFGIGAAVVTPIIKYFLDQGVFFTFLYMGLIYFAVIFLLGIFLREPPDDFRKLTLINPEIEEDEDYNLIQALKDKRFHILWFSFAFSSFAGLMVIGNAVPILEEAISPQDLKLIIPAFLIATSFCNAGGRIFWGNLLDRIGPWRAMEVNFVVTMVALMTLSFSYSNRYLVIPLGGVIYANYGGLLALFPSAVALFFGKKYLGRIYGAVFTSWGVAGLMGAVGGGFIRDLTGSYFQAFYVAVIFSMLALFLVYRGSKIQRV
jgi:OFA family oxalate/formate antiporter-like MFS transporter